MVAGARTKTGNSTPSTFANRYSKTGDVKMPITLLETVKSSAIAKFPPACLAITAPELIVHGMQKKMICGGFGRV
jgi:hypothetical protein